MITGPLYPKIINCKKKNLVLQGGTSSAKTVTTLQALGTIATQEQKADHNNCPGFTNIKKGCAQGLSNLC